MKKCPNCYKKCIDVLEYSGKCPCCKEAIQTPVFFFCISNDCPDDYYVCWRIYK